MADSPICVCHGVPMFYRRGHGYNCRIKQRERSRAYQRTLSGQRAKKHSYRVYMAKRIRMGKIELGVAGSPELAAVINAHIKARRRAFRLDVAKKAK